MNNNHRKRDNGEIGKRENYEFLLACCSQGMLKGKVFWTISVITGTGRHREQNLYIYTSSTSNKQKNGQREFKEKSIKQGFCP